MSVEEQAQQFSEAFKRVKEEVAKAIVGQDNVITETLITILGGGHALLEGVPGLGKTYLVRTLSEVLEIKFSRIQFTPDLMPADITGIDLIREDPTGGKRFEFQPGPIFANIVLADEINRATPKTQSAMLEAMQEHSVTTSGVMRRLIEPFFVLATQNPLEMEGTYPLPEAQLDRFFFKVMVPFPGLEELTNIITRTTGRELAKVSKVIGPKNLMEMQAFVREVPVAAPVLKFAMQVVLATHPELASSPARVRKLVNVGSSPRGGQTLIMAGRIRALLDGRYNVGFNDVAVSARPALRHRIILNFEGEAEGITTDDLIEEILTLVPRGE
ncbi:MAG: MoxR family ATPase [Candidatus Sumerlaeota bacterium]|nr:MoxR family ATPase [Candidatus Sumerlaeota bacterium]